MRRIVYFCFALFIIACQNPSEQGSKTEEETIKAAVYLSSGDNYPLFNSLGIPTFFNIARVINQGEKPLDAIILSERENKGSKVSIVPLALFSFEKDTTLFEYIVCIPAETENPYIGSNYNDFLLKNQEIQSGIEDWFAAQCKDAVCRNFRWESAYKALLYIHTQEN